MWSAGVIFYQLVCNGAQPFRVANKHELFESIQIDDPDTFNYDFCRS